MQCMHLDNICMQPQQQATGQGVWYQPPRQTRSVKGSPGKGHKRIGPAGPDTSSFDHGKTAESGMSKTENQMAGNMADLP